MVVVHLLKSHYEYWVPSLEVLDIYLERVDLKKRLWRKIVVYYSFRMKIIHLIIWSDVINIVSCFNNWKSYQNTMSIQFERDFTKQKITRNHQKIYGTDGLLLSFAICFCFSSQRFVHAILDKNILHEWQQGFSFFFCPKKR